VLSKNPAREISKEPLRITQSTMENTNMAVNKRENCNKFGSPSSNVCTFSTLICHCIQIGGTSNKKDWDESSLLGIMGGTWGTIVVVGIIFGSSTLDEVALSCSLLWGVTTEAMEYEEVAKKRI
jgi:hypothetical protein